MALIHKPKFQIPADFDGPVQVFAVGLPRCATSTLKQVFEDILKIGPCMHMSRCLPQPSKMQSVYHALRERDTMKRRDMLRDLMNGCAASADFPGHLFVDDLVEMYPDALFILNVRNDGGKAWSQSMKSTITPFLSWKYALASFWSTSDWWLYLSLWQWQISVHEQFGMNSIASPEYYDAHNEKVRQVLQAHNKSFVEWDPSAGWGPLCKFLDQKIPDQDLPRNNERAMMEKVVLWRTMIGIKLWIKNLGFGAIGCVAAYCAITFGSKIRPPSALS